MSDGLEQLDRHRRAIAATVPFLDAIRSLAEMAFRRAEAMTLPVAGYAEQVKDLLAAALGALADGEQRSLLSAATDGSPQAILVIAAERGFCGAFNDRLVQKALAYIRECCSRGESVLVFCWGTRGRQLLERAGQPVAHAAPLPSFTLPPYGDVEAMALRLLGAQEQVGSVSVTAIHNAPVKRWQYETTIRRLFPPATGAPRRGTDAAAVMPPGDAPGLVVHLLTEYLLIELYRAVVESALSEQLARIATMHLAADNARRLHDELTRDYNLARQHAETNALLEILTGYQATTESLPRI